MGFINDVMGTFTEPRSYPDSTAAEMSKEEFESSDLLKTILAKAKGGLHGFTVTIGALGCPFERSGMQNRDKSLRYFSEFGDLGSFSYLIVDGYDVMDVLPDRLKVDKLLNEGAIEYTPRVPSFIERWAPCFK
jgi:hypothetical protein